MSADERVLKVFLADYAEKVREYTTLRNAVIREARFVGWSPQAIGTVAGLTTDEVQAIIKGSTDG